MLSTMKQLLFLATKKRRIREFEHLASAGLPKPVVAAVDTLLRGGGQGCERVMHLVESARDEISKGGNQSVEIFYSPKPGSSGSAATAAMRPAPGATLDFTMERVAKTGKDKRWGCVLYVLARESKAETLLELGSCAGISGAYLASSEYCRALHTIEGSTALSYLAKKTLDRVNATDKAHIYNDLFDDALDEIIPQTPRIDLAFIDGHHEKVATIHYWERIASKMRPGGIVIFDDISWSADMRDAWRKLSRDNRFSHAADFGPIGVCIIGEDANDSVKHWDLQPILGKTKIGSPHGWRKRPGDLISSN